MSKEGSDTRAKRMRAYEDPWKPTIGKGEYTVVRVDGRAFHTLTRDAKRPFDPDFMKAMDAVAVTLTQEIQGAQFAYTQSDEVSVLFTDFGATQERWFGGDVAKICSVAASIASNAFNRWWPLGPQGCGAQFDARVFTLPDRAETINYFLWRQADSNTNAVSMAAQAMFSPKQLLHKTTRDRLWMLEEAGVDFCCFDGRTRLGSVTARKSDESEITFTHKGTGQTMSAVVTRSIWEARPAPWFDWDQVGFLEDQVPHRPGRDEQ